MKNYKLRSYLFENQISHRKASRILNMDASDFSKLLKYELTEEEQDRFIKRIERGLQEIVLQEQKEAHA